MAREPSGKSMLPNIGPFFGVCPPGANVGCSEVHRARSKRTGALYALKKIIMHNEKDGVSAVPSWVMD